MKLNKKIAIMAIVAATSLFANTQNIESIVDKINQTTDAGKKGLLLKELTTEFATLNVDEQKKANEIINAKLKDPLKIN